MTAARSPAPRSSSSEPADPRSPTTPGHYVIASVPGGERRLRARRLGFMPLEVDLSVPSAGVVSVDFHLQVGGVSSCRPIGDDRRGPPPGSRSPAPGRRAECPHAPSSACSTARPASRSSGIGAGARALLGPEPAGARQRALRARGRRLARPDASRRRPRPRAVPSGRARRSGAAAVHRIAPSVSRAASRPAYDGGLSDVLLLERPARREGTRASAFVDMLSAGGTFETGERRRRAPSPPRSGRCTAPGREGSSPPASRNATRTRWSAPTSTRARARTPSRSPSSTTRSRCGSARPRCATSRSGAIPPARCGTTCRRSSAAPSSAAPTGRSIRACRSARRTR